MKATTLACAIAGLGLVQVGAAGAAQRLEVSPVAIGPAWDVGLGPGRNTSAPSLGVGGSLGGASPPQLSLSSPRLELPGGSLGPQISVDRYTHDGVNLTTAEVGSRYFTDIAPGLELGVGPGVGYTWSDADAGKAADLWGLQVGADIHYRQGSLSMGLDTRYRWSEDQALGTGGPVPDSWLTRLNLGVSF